MFVQLGPNVLLVDCNSFRFNKDRFFYTEVTQIQSINAKILKSDSMLFSNFVYLKLTRAHFQCYVNTNLLYTFVIFIAYIQT